MPLPLLSPRDRITVCSLDVVLCARHFTGIGRYNLTGICLLFLILMMILHIVSASVERGAVVVLDDDHMFPPPRDRLTVCSLGSLVVLSNSKHLLVCTLFVLLVDAAVSE